MCSTHKIALNFIFVKQKDTGIPEKKKLKLTRFFEGCYRKRRDIEKNRPGFDRQRGGEYPLGNEPPGIASGQKMEKATFVKRWPNKKSSLVGVIGKILLNPIIVNSDNSENSIPFPDDTD